MENVEFALCQKLQALKFEVPKNNKRNLKLDYNVFAGDAQFYDAAAITYDFDK